MSDQLVSPGNNSVVEVIDHNSLLNNFIRVYLHGMPAGHDVSRFRSGIFFFLRRSHKSTS